MRTSLRAAHPEALALFALALFALALFALALFAAQASGQENEIGEKFEVECTGGADSNLNTNESVCRRVVIDNGATVITADLATTRKFDFEESEWRLTGKVRIEFESAVLTADSAVFVFVRNELVGFELSGEPVSMSVSIAARQMPVTGTAQTIAYDNRTETLRLLGEVHFDDGNNTTEACDLIYNMRENTSNAGSPECGVRFSLSPRNNAAATEDAPGAP